MIPPTDIVVSTMGDARRARRAAARLAEDVGLRRFAVEGAALATMELATNLVRYAEKGRIKLSLVESGGGLGLQVEARDSGPGILDVDRALQDGFSSGGGLGGGLPAVRRLMDEFEITSSTAGTTVVARKWATPSRLS